MFRPRTVWMGGLVAAAAAGILLPGAATRAQQRPVRVRITFQPDCYRPSLASACDKRKTGTRLDLGPQIAIWVESADRTRFIDTLMVTNAVGFRGIGNRPGIWNMPSNPKFPYGKRRMALPVWAAARGRLYDTIVMQDGADRESWMGFHEGASSPDPYFCRPMTFTEIDVDAITCPTTVFQSVKGKLSKTDPRTPYPPRNDLRSFTDRDCDMPSAGRPDPNCAVSARQFADINDLDAVTTATPPYGQPFARTWVVPADLPDGPYAINVEVSKEFDNNVSHAHVSYTDPSLAEWGMKNAMGQPSVVYRAVFTLDRAVGDQVAVTDIAGYGDWNGNTGTRHPPDPTISDAPGSGRGRLLVIEQPSIAPGGAPVRGRVHVTTDSPPPGTNVPDGGPGDDGDGGAPDDGPAAGDDDAGPGSGDARACPLLPAQVNRLSAPPRGVDPESATVTFGEPVQPAFGAIESYEVRVWEGADLTEAAFASGAPSKPLAPIAPGHAMSVTVTDVKSQRTYTVGVRPVGECVDGIVSYATFTTPVRKFAQLSGCFIATAAYGSAQARELGVLRQARDRARGASTLAAAAIALYERSSPPLADMLRESDGGRALVRRALAPIVGLARAAGAGGPRPRP